MYYEPDTVAICENIHSVTFPTEVSFSYTDVALKVNDAPFLLPRYLCYLPAVYFCWVSFSCNNSKAVLWTAHVVV